MSKTTRVQMEVPQATMDTLRALKDKTEAASHAEVIRKALWLHETLLKEIESGGEFFLKSSDGRSGPFVVYGAGSARQEEGQ